MTSQTVTDMEALSRAVLEVKSRIRRRKRLVMPPELWLAVFENGCLSARDISNVRLTCCSFANLGKGQAFSYFTFRPFQFQGTHSRQRLSDTVFTHQSHRLEYWTSESVAPFVRWCTIYPIFDFTLTDDDGEDQCDPGPLLDDFFRFLPRFIILQRLECQHIPFSDLALSQLCQLGKLVTLEVADCVITAHTAPATLKVTNVHFTSCNTLSTSQDRGNVGWLDVVHPEHIRRISIAFGDWRIASLRGIMTKRTPDLHVDPGAEVNCINRHLAMILSHPLALEELHIHFDEWCEEAELSVFYIPLPTLRVYEGSPHFSSWFTTGEALRSLTLTHSGYAAPEAIIRSLECQSHSVESLTVHVTNVPDAFFKMLCAEYTHLKELVVWARHIKEDEVSFFSSIILVNFASYLLSGHRFSDYKFTTWHRISDF